MMTQIAWVDDGELRGYYLYNGDLELMFNLGEEPAIVETMANSMTSGLDALGQFLLSLDGIGAEEGEIAMETVLACFRPEVEVFTFAGEIIYDVTLEGAAETFGLEEAGEAILAILL